MIIYNKLKSLIFTKIRLFLFVLNQALHALDWSSKTTHCLMKDLGIDITPISRIEVSRTSIDVNKTNLITNKTKFETIEVKVLKRGVLGVNKIGYVF